MWQLVLSALRNVVFLFGYFASGSFPKALSKQREEELFKKFKEEGDLSARDELIESNLRLVAYVVKKYRKENKDSEDFISIGTIGLIKAVNSFNPDKNIRLATYAVRCIENATLSQWLFLKMMQLIIHSSAKMC